MPTTLQTLLENAAARLAAVADSARFDAELLLAHVLRKPRSHLRAWPEQPMEESVQHAFDTLLVARIAGTPLAYLIGEREFWSLPIKVTHDTLIPRPETEMLVEAALGRIPADAAWRIADLGCGSGAIALALASERLLCRVTATDVSSRALDVARENAAHLGLGNLSFCCGDWFMPLQDTRFHMIVSNPPYVGDHDPHLNEGDLRFEPRRALACGADGLNAIRHIVTDAPEHLEVGGWLLLEHGYDQAQAVRALLSVQNFDNVTSLPDLAGHERVTLGQMK